MIEEITGLLICLPPRPKRTSYLFRSSGICWSLTSGGWSQELVLHTQGLGRSGRFQPFLFSTLVKSHLRGSCSRFRPRKPEKSFFFSLSCWISSGSRALPCFTPKEGSGIGPKSSPGLRLCSMFPVIVVVRIFWGMLGQKNCAVYIRNRGGLEGISPTEVS